MLAGHRLVIADWVQQVLWRLGEVCSLSGAWACLQQGRKGREVRMTTTSHAGGRCSVSMRHVSRMHVPECLTTVIGGHCEHALQEPCSCQLDCAKTSNQDALTVLASSIVAGR